jgi:hypothetical protein
MKKRCIQVDIKTSALYRGVADILGVTVEALAARLIRECLRQLREEVEKMLAGDDIHG